MIVTKISLADLHCARLLLYYALYSVKLWLLKWIHTYMLYIGNTERGWMPMKRVWWPTWSSSNSVSRALDDSNIAAVSKVHNNNNVFHIWLGLAKLISCIRKHTSNDSPNSFLLLQLTTTLYYFWQSKKQQHFKREDRTIYFSYLATFPSSKLENLL